MRWVGLLSWGLLSGVFGQLSITTGVLGRDERFQLQKLPPTQLDSLRAAARAGNTDAQMALVEYYQLVELKPDSARFYLQAAVKAGRPEAQYLMGLIYLRGVEGPKRPTEGRKLLEAAARQGFILAIRELWTVLEPPDSVGPLTVRVLPYEPKAAFQYAQQGAQLGDPPSMMALGRYYGQGKGTPRNDSLARVWLTRAAEAGYRPAQVLLAEWAFERWGDPATALYWAQRVISDERASLEEQYRARIAAYHAEHIPKWIAAIRRLWLPLSSPAQAQP